MKISIGSLKKIGLIILMVLVLLLSGSAVANIFSISNPIRVVLGLLFILPFVNNLIHERKDILLLFALYGVMFVFSVVVNTYNYRYILTVLICIMIGYSISRNIDQQKFMMLFLISMEIMAAISIICYILLNFTSITLPFTFHNSFSGIRYGVGYIFNYLPYQKLRNCGMFWEPGLMATFMTYSLIIDSIYFNSPSKIRSIIFILAFITTNSSAGIVLLILSIAFLAFRRYGGENASKGEMILLIVISILSIFLFLNYDSFLSMFVQDGNNVVQKLFTDRLLASERMQSITFWWNRFWESPIFGNSITSVSETFIWDTATSFMFIGLFGFLGSIYTIGWIRGIWKLDLSNSCKVLLLLIILVIVNKEPHAAILFSWILMFSFLTYTRIRYNKFRKLGTAGSKNREDKAAAVW